mgnify:CR=1 FL=1
MSKKFFHYIKIAYLTLLGVLYSFNSYSTQAVCQLTNNSAPQLSITNVDNVLDSCSLTPECITTRNSRRDKLWGQNYIDADLMNQRMREINPNVSQPMVAVLDHGFDTNQLEYLETQSLRTRFEDPFKQKSGEKLEATKHHGTFVTGIVAGSNGVGVAPGSHLSVKDIFTKADKEYQRIQDSSLPLSEKRNYTRDSVLSSEIKIGLLEACNNGYRIINLSIALSSSVQNEMEVIDDNLVRELASKGCLVVKAGSYSKKDIHDNNDIDDAVLTVSALNPSGADEGVSDHGEIFAPGINIYSLDVSKEADDKKEFSSVSSCSKGDNGRVDSGTSFAAPMVTGVAAQVDRVLRMDPCFLSLEGRTRVQLLNRILMASKLRDSVNGLRAVEIANLWVQDRGLQEYDSFNREKKLQRFCKKQNKNNFTEFSVKELQSLLEKSNQPICSQSFDSCLNTRACGERKKCILNARKKAALCVSPSKEVMVDLMLTADQDGHYELANQYFKQYYQSQPTLNEQDAMLSAFINSDQEFLRLTSAITLIETGKWNQQLQAVSYEGLMSDSEILRNRFIDKLTHKSFKSVDEYREFVFGLFSAFANAQDNLQMSGSDQLDEALRLLFDRYDYSKKLVKRLEHSKNQNKMFLIHASQEESGRIDSDISVEKSMLGVFLMAVSSEDKLVRRGACVFMDSYPLENINFKRYCKS